MKGRKPLSLGVLSGAVVAALCSLLPAGVAGAAPPRVPANFFGTNFQAIGYLDARPALQRAHIDAFSGAAIRQVRLNIAWSVVEPVPPSGGKHDYRWGRLDARLTNLARAGVRVQALMTQPPSWNAKDTIECDLFSCTDVCQGAGSKAPQWPGPYADFASAVADRYGRDGRFWKLHPELPRLPIVRYEIWNEPNLRGGWCPQPDPPAYASMFLRAASAIRSVDSGAELVIGGLAIPKEESSDYLNPSTFLARAVRAKPELISRADAVAVHIYPATDPNRQLKKVAIFRDEVRRGGVPNRMPMLINELGWSTFQGAVTEAERAKGYSHAATKLSRTNCNVLGLLPHTWTTAEATHSIQQYFGIAHPTSAALYDSAKAYSSGIQLMRGQLKQDPPTRTLTACDGMPLPDQDRDGTPDEDDRAPLDPGVRGPGGGDSGGGGSGGGGGGGGSGGGPGGGRGNAPCTITGDSGPNVLRGTRGPDVICGRGGRDVILGRRGADVIRGGGGRDLIRGGAGRDLVKGGRGADIIAGNRGADLLKGGRGADILRGGPGRDVLKGGRGKDRIRQ